MHVPAHTCIAMSIYLLISQGICPCTYLCLLVCIFCADIHAHDYLQSAGAALYVGNSTDATIADSTFANNSAVLVVFDACMHACSYITTSHNSFFSSLGWNECGCDHCYAMPDHVTALPQKYDGALSEEPKMDGAGVYSTDCTRIKIERSQFLRNKATVRCHRHRCCGTILVRLHWC